MDKIEKSLKRAQGQLKGVVGMYTENKSCLEVVQQVAAVRQALGRIGRELLKREACQCMTKDIEKKKFDRILKQLFKS